MTNLSLTSNEANQRSTDVGTAARSSQAGHNLRLVLRSNALTSALSGAVGLVGAGYWSERLGIDNVVVTALVSIGLVLFALDVVRTSRVPDERLRSGALLVSIGDIVWIIASAVVVALGLLTPFGTVAAIVIAIGVADFAALQLWFRSRL